MDTVVHAAAPVIRGDRPHYPPCSAHPGRRGQDEHRHDTSRRTESNRRVALTGLPERWRCGPWPGVVDQSPRPAPLRAELVPLLSGGVVERLLDTYEALVRRSGLRLIDDEDALDAAREAPVIFEGAQGVLLDPRFGFPPHVTKTWTTSHNARQLLAAGSGWRTLRVGVLRVFPTRHGAGPFVTRDPALDARLPEQHNGESPWQGPFLRGWPDAVALRYALEVECPDGLAITHLDALSAFESCRICTAYQPTAGGPGTITALPAPAPGRSQPVELATTLAGCRPRYEAAAPSELPARLLELASATAPVMVESRGPTWADKRVRVVP